VSSLGALIERYRAPADPLRTERRVELVAGLLALALVLQVAFGAARLAITVGPDAVPPSVDSLQVLRSLPLDAVTTEQSTEIRNRPLFWPTRRPAAPVAVDTAAPVSEKQQASNELKLLGVFGAGDTIGIIVRVKDSTRRIRLGEEVSGWKLKSVEESGAVVVSGSRQKTLQLLPNQVNKPERAGNKKRTEPERH
jgi:hypothetical protein